MYGEGKRCELKVSSRWKRKRRIREEEERERKR